MEEGKERRMKGREELTEDWTGELKQKKGGGGDGSKEGGERRAGGSG